MNFAHGAEKDEAASQHLAKSVKRLIIAMIHIACAINQPSINLIHAIYWTFELSGSANFSKMRSRRISVRRLISCEWWCVRASNLFLPPKSYTLNIFEEMIPRRLITGDEDISLSQLKTHSSTWRTLLLCLQLDGSLQRLLGGFSMLSETSHRTINWI